MLVPTHPWSRLGPTRWLACLLVVVLSTSISSAQTAGDEAGGIPSLTLDAEPRELATGAGREEQVRILLTNSGNSTLGLTLHAEEVVPAGDSGRPSGLEFSFQDHRIELAPSSSFATNLTIRVPEKAWMRDTSIAVTATLPDSAQNESITIRARVFGVPDPERTSESGVPVEETGPNWPSPAAAAVGTVCAFACAVTLLRRR